MKYDLNIMNPNSNSTIIKDIIFGAVPDNLKLGYLYVDEKEPFEQGKTAPPD
jgi:hypothetical protein